MSETSNQKMNDSTKKSNNKKMYRMYKCPKCHKYVFHFRMVTSTERNGIKYKYDSSYRERQKKYNKEYMAKRYAQEKSKKIKRV